MIAWPKDTTGYPFRYKDPDAVLDYRFDWSDWLAGDTIASVDWVLSSGLTKDSDTQTSTTATVWVSGGAVGTTYAVTCRVTTASGRTEDRTIHLIVKER